MDYAEFAELLHHAMGLDATSIGPSAVERAVSDRLRACEVDLDAYRDLVRSSAAELQSLIEAVIVPETWFFRECEAFAELARFASEDRRSAVKDRVLRILSLPCSSGEEPYSMAMALGGARPGPVRWRIDAVDISVAGLAHARHGLYGKNSFRGDHLQFRDRYFDARADGWHLHDAVRQDVHFQQGNMLDDGFLEDAEAYDVIFCRNLLIYFDHATQTRAIEVLQRLLKPAGVLFVGSAEGGLLLNHDFTSRAVPLAFAFQRRLDAAPGALARTGSVGPSPTTDMLSSGDRAQRAPAASGAAQTAIADRPLADAQTLAGQGRLAEAARCCEQQLRKHGPCARTYFLMGLIGAATGELAQARECYRKALYLDRDHHDTLVHLYLLLEKQGDATGAKVLRERMQRLQGRRTA